MSLSIRELDRLYDDAKPRHKVGIRNAELQPRRTWLYQEEPGFSPETGLWFYGNVKLLSSLRLAYVSSACGPPVHTPDELQAIELEAEALVLASSVLVCGFHSPAHQRVAVVPLRWGCPRIVVMSGGFRHHLGDDLSDEPFRAARLWRYQWDPKLDLAISRRAPDKLPTFASHNPTVDRMIRLLAKEEWPGLRVPSDLLTRLTPEWS